jgi:LysM repeat protein
MTRLLFFISLLPAFAFAQNKPLVVQGTSPDLFLTHTVAPKENYYSIGRLYNVSPRDQIAPFNSLELEKGLSPGQVIKIPLTALNFLQSGNAAKDESLIPVYHIVSEKEGLYRISVNHNKVPVETIKQWNKITGESVSNGTNLIVGYLKVKTALSALSGNASIPPLVIAPKGENDPMNKNLKDAGNPVIGDGPLPPVKIPDPNPVVITPKADPPKPAKVPAKEIMPVQSDILKGTGDNFNGGVFKTLYQSNNPAKESGTAGVFKSTSGCEDGKYYCLHNAAPAGTIIKVTNTATGKSIYAKVLDVIPDIKQNNGLIIRISNAAADILGAVENKFECAISYSN